MDKVFFNSWESVVRTVILTVMGYISIVVLLRISGKRTLSKMNAFDFIITIALGSTLASVCVSRNVSLLDGAVAMGLLVLLQFVITRLSTRNKSFYRTVTSAPRLLVYKGTILQDNLKRERVTVEELYAALRRNNVTEISEVQAVVLENTGTLEVITAKVDFEHNPVFESVKK